MKQNQIERRVDSYYMCVKTNTAEKGGKVQKHQKYGYWSLCVMTLASPHFFSHLYLIEKS